MSASRYLTHAAQSAATMRSLGWLLIILSQFASTLQSQDLSWVNGAIERSKTATRESLPAWQFDPRVAAGSTDASLNALAVVNPDRLFAVGDRGLILASTDGGRTWNPQTSGTSLNLYGVAFFDEQHGVAVGGSVQPLSRTSLGIVLVTQDAGRSWDVVNMVNKASLPRLNGVSIDSRQGVRAWGDFSSAHNSSLFESQDLGRSWQPVASQLGHLQCVAREASGVQLGIDHAGRLAQLPTNTYRALTQLAPPTAPINALIHTGTHWIAVGDSGTLTSSRDGLQWVDHALPLSSTARNVCNFQCAAAVEQNVWVAGAPGSIVLHSADAGNSWRLVQTQQHWPIRAIQFADRHRGWIVTTSGSILATRDGGASWYPQRVPVKRLGLQIIATSAADVGWPAVADATWQARQATSVLAMHRENMEDAVDSTPDMPTALRALGTQVGLVSAHQSSTWPALAKLQSPAVATSSSQVVFDPGMEEYLAMQIRMGQPSVVLIDDPQGTRAGNGPFADSIAHSMTLAASNAPSSAWLSNELHLEPWTVSKLMCVTGDGKADVTITHDQLLRDSGLAVSDVLAPMFGWQSLKMQNTGLRCLQMQSGNQAGRQNLFAAHDRHAEAARLAELSKVGNLPMIMGRVHREKAWQTLAPKSLNIDEEPASWTKKLESLIEQTPRYEVGPALLLLGQSCLEAKQWERWSIAMERAAAGIVLTDSTRYGSLTILRGLASDERLAWQFNTPPTLPNGSSTDSSGQLAKSVEKKRLGNPLVSNPFESGDQSTDAVVSTQGTTAVGSAQPLVQLVAHEVSVNPAEAARVDALKKSVAEFNRLIEVDRTLTARPEIQLAHFARRRALAELLHEPLPDPTVLQPLMQASQLAGWPQVALQETVLASGRATLPAWTAHALWTQSSPLIDGKRNDACWSACRPIELSNPFGVNTPTTTGRSTTRAQFAYDDEFLYVLLTCPQLAGAAPARSPGSPGSSDAKAKVPRRYDMNLDGSDHLVLSFDTDRDYTSQCELGVNAAGHTFDRCCHSRQWNPRWYVAVDSAPTGDWTAEFAVRLSDLTTATEVKGRAWCLSAFRYIPDGEVQSWSQLRSMIPQPQGNGLLLFD